MPHTPIEHRYQIEASPDGARVWINGFDGSSIGRFSKRFGMDIHTTATQQLAGEGECLFCTHRPAGHEDWLVFCQKIKEHYNIDVPADLLQFDDTAAKVASKVRP